MSIATLPNSKRLSVPQIKARKISGEKISALTAYDYCMARLLDRAGIDLILVGDSLSSVVQGIETTLPVSLDEIIYHSRCVMRAVRHALVVADMPFMSYQSSIVQALEACGRVLKESGVSAVKLEGGINMAETIRRIVQIDIPVMGHVGLTPQSYHRMGGHKRQGQRTKSGDELVPGSRERVLEDARAIAEAGVFSMVLEGIPADLAAEITAAVPVPTIGIAAGPDCDGQILVTHDMLGLMPGLCPPFVKQYAALGEEVVSAAQRYTAELRASSSPKERTGNLS